MSFFAEFKASEICQCRASQIRGSLFPREYACLTRAHATHIPERHQNAGSSKCLCLPSPSLLRTCWKCTNLKVRSPDFFFLITFYPFPVIFILLLFLLLSLKAMNRNGCRWSSVVKAFSKWSVAINTEGSNNEFFRHFHTEFANALKGKYVFQCSKWRIISSLKNGT